jgi:hypothetical protein
MLGKLLVASAFLVGAVTALSQGTPQPPPGGSQPGAKPPPGGPPPAAKPGG